MQNLETSKHDQGTISQDFYLHCRVWTTGSHATSPGFPQINAPVVSPADSISPAILGLDGSLGVHIPARCSQIYQILGQRPTSRQIQSINIAPVVSICCPELLTYLLLSPTCWAMLQTTPISAMSRYGCRPDDCALDTAAWASRQAGGQAAEGYNPSSCRFSGQAEVGRPFAAAALSKCMQPLFLRARRRVAVALEFSESNTTTCPAGRRAI